MAYTKLESKLSKLQMSKDLKSAKFKKKKKHSEDKLYTETFSGGGS